ncbi:cytidylyltransferase domain-containing protein [Kordiimonas pumila]|uniref:Cytidylyltransferase domain-containing protein n=1 Tax=Kordiimonas pumila TaxID=2161677 RepID=A0ABV7D265_9PROT|nr:NTP transferase domain-containing protein [Kordiimonas pumila]
MGEKIIAVIGARLNSSRLPRKQLLPLAGKPLIARLVDRLRTVKSLDDIILATTGDDYNGDLVNWAEEYGITVEAYNGDVNDLVGRVDSVVQKHNADMLLYVCGDCPLVEPASIEKWVDAMLADPACEMAAFMPRNDSKKYIHEGFDLFRRSFWDRMEKVALEPFEREHIGAVYHHLHKVSPNKIANVIDDDIYASCDHRLSVDTSSDYFFMRRIYEDWYKDNGPESLVDLKTVIQRILADPDLTKTNKEVRQRKVGEECPRVVIFCEAGPTVGLGHLSRVLVVIQALQDHLSASVMLCIKGQALRHSALALVPHCWVDSFSNFTTKGKVWDAAVVDVKTLDQPLFDVLEQLPDGTLKIAVDQDLKLHDTFDFMWQPCMYLDEEAIKPCADKVEYGWHTFLLRAGNNTKKPDHDQNRVVVLTGGSDAAGLGAVWPEKLLAVMNTAAEIDWVQGPFAAPPVMLAGAGMNILHAPDNLTDLLPSYTAALVVFGVSYFECLLAGVPAVVSNAAGAAKPKEWAYLKTLFPEFTADTDEEAFDKLLKAVRSADTNKLQALQDQMRQGPANFANRIGALLAARKVEYADAS